MCGSSASRIPRTSSGSEASLTNDLSVEQLFAEAGRKLRSDFESVRRTNPHAGERGGEAEALLRQFLNEHLPGRFRADTGIVMDDSGARSRQSDVLVYDALNSPVYRHGRMMILPSDNVAVVVEVKSTLSKAELEDAAKKVASVKTLAKSPPSNVDRPAVSAPLAMTRTLGVVFAYEANTSLNALAENLANENVARSGLEHIDLVVVLGQGVISMVYQEPLGPEFIGWCAGPLEEGARLPPYFVHVVIEESSDLTLNRFFYHLMQHLTVFRHRSAVSYAALLKSAPGKVQTVRGYQYNLAGRLVEAPPEHRAGHFQSPEVRYNLFQRGSRQFLGQVCWMRWQDGAVVIYSGKIDPNAIFSPFGSPPFVRARRDAAAWASALLPLTEREFKKVIETFAGDVEVHRDNEPGWAVPGVPDDPQAP
jgi:hypothetical protein